MATGVVTGATITVGMIYSTAYDNYSCYLIEIVNTPEEVTIEEFNMFV